MQKVNSFLVDHRKLKPGVYMTTQFAPNDFATFVYDIRFVAPKDANEKKIFMTSKVAHTLEHFFANYFRSVLADDFSKHVAYVGPMGCLTGFYLVTTQAYSEQEVARLVLNCCNEILAAKTIPGASELTCGNYTFFDLDPTKDFIIEQIIPNLNPSSLETDYPLIKGIG